MEGITISSFEDKKTIYRELLPQLKSLVAGEEDFIANAANISAALKQALPYVSWVGFYFLKVDGHAVGRADNKQGELVVGPFQGKVACTRLRIGSGVCGVAFDRRKTTVVPNVYEFPGHIFCDPDSKSEIVVPIFKNEEPFGVLDLDSPEYSSFDSVDAEYLEKVAEMVSQCFSNSRPVLDGNKR